MRALAIADDAVVDTTDRSLRCFLIGSKNLAVDVLDVLVAQGHQVLGVLSRDHEPGMQVWLNELGHRSLAGRAVGLGIPVYKNVSINSPEMTETLVRMRLDILFSVFWGEMVEETILNIPRLGCFNLHTAYLPRNRGCFPLPWAIINDEKLAGLTIHKMLPRADDGPIVAQAEVPIRASETGESLYRRVIAVGTQLFAETLPKFADLSYALTPQREDNVSYHPRGRPHGGQINPYWDAAKKDRFTRALYFPPFLGHASAPPSMMKGYEEPSVRIMLGFDCDRPRGPLVASEKGAEMARVERRSLYHISSKLDDLGIPRTLFLCGAWLESMAYRFTAPVVQEILHIDSLLVEVGDHSHSHSPLKAIKARPSQEPVSSCQVAAEYRKNTGLFYDILGMDVPHRGYRTPYGYYGGLVGEHATLDALGRVGVRYVSSDLRGPGDSLFAPLECGVPRQPYRYENGLLEIPSAGWQDTAFLKSACAPKRYGEIVGYYRVLLQRAWEVAQRTGRDYFLGLVMHPLDIARYDTHDLFADLYDCAQAIDATFCTYGDVCEHWEHS